MVRCMRWSPSDGSWFCWRTFSADGRDRQWQTAPRGVRAASQSGGLFYSDMCAARTACRSYYSPCRRAADPLSLHKPLSSAVTGADFAEPRYSTVGSRLRWARVALPDPTIRARSIPVRRHGLERLYASANERERKNAGFYLSLKRSYYSENLALGETPYRRQRVLFQPLPAHKHGTPDEEALPEGGGSRAGAEEE